MKISFIGQKGIPVEYGGVEVHVEEIAKRLVQMGYEVDVYCNHKYMKYKENSYCGINLINVNSVRGKYTDTIVHSFLSTILCVFRKNYDIIHYHSIVPSFSSVIAVIFGKKIVITIHSLQWYEKNWNFLVKCLTMLFTKFIIHIPKRIIVVSRMLQKYFKRVYNIDTIYIPNGAEIPEKLFEPVEIKKKFGLEKNNYILWMGRITQEKRVDWLIQVFNFYKNSELKGKYLVIAGHLLKEDDMVKKITENNERIIFTGFVSGKVKKELLSNAYLYIYPSYIEGLPISLLEAMAYGNICLASNIPSIKEIIIDGVNGLLFDFRSIESLKNKIQEYLKMDENKKEEIRKNAVEKIRKDYNWDEITKNIVKIYKDVAVCK